jgi:hypothetical protein
MSQCLGRSIYRARKLKYNTRYSDFSNSLIIVGLSFFSFNFCYLILEHSG